MAEHRPAETGSASIWLLSASGVVGVAATVAVLLGQTEVAGHRAAAAADLGAIAAADAAELGESAACTTAARVATAAGGRLVSCVVVDGVSDVQTQAELPRALRRFGRSSARSRAGPASAASASGPGTSQ